MVLDESKRDQRVRDSLTEQVRHAGVVEACAMLAGARRAEQLNVAKVLELEPPQRLAVTVRADASAHLVEIARLLGVRSCT